ncbi:hypothetical protein [Azospirillum brasilense]|uniref:hypothetical protein n=1 Tax=Azospirillum brasilense TaxID=192 RepID=UPI001EDA306A|nr:hypothetical protein [Azospirillum brasilense]UKJ74243.1 hypothetical protein H1Q64_06570 [Azospirillum brasilense]
MNVNSAIHAVALQLAQTEAWVERTAEPLAAANKKYERIQIRMADLDRQRADLIARRQRGEQHPDDAANMTLIDADREGLAALLEEASAAVAAARKLHEDAKRAVDVARHQLQRTENEGVEESLIEHASKLDELLLATVKQLDEVRKRLGGGRPTWSPSNAIMNEFNRLRLQRGVM